LQTGKNIQETDTENNAVCREAQSLQLCSLTLMHILMSANMFFLYILSAIMHIMCTFLRWKKNAATTLEMETTVVQN